MSAIPIDLIESIEEGNFVLFAGPRVSIAPKDLLGPPGEALLAMELSDRLGIELEEYSFPWVAQKYAIKKGLNALNKYVSTRLGDGRYQPTKLHHLIARLPFYVVVYTAQDILLRNTFIKHNVVIKEFALGIDGEVKVRPGTFIQLFGTVEKPKSLILTEDDRRKTISGNTDLASDLRALSGNHNLIFLGQTFDSSFREFYFQLRLVKEDRDLPRAFLVWPEAKQDDDRYWGERYATVLPLDTQEFLEELVDSLVKRGNVPVLPDVDYEAPPPMSEDDLLNRNNIVLEFGKRFGYSTSYESSGHLTLKAGSSALYQQVISEEDILQSAPEGTAAASSEGAEGLREELNAQIQLQRGNVERARGNHAQALEAFEEAIRRDPELTDAYLSQYYLLVEINNLEAANDVYQNLLQRAPSYAFLPERYHIEEILGKVDLGISYCVKDDELKDLVTITVLHRTYMQQLEDLKKFVNDVSKIKSKRISRIIESNRYSLHNYLVTEYIEGPLLKDYLKNSGKLSFDEAMRIADQVASALEEGNQKGVPHLGLKPANIVMSKDGAKLVNYGFSRLLEATSSNTGPPAKGSVEYNSPEQKDGELGDERSDVYALGTLLYEMLIGRPPGVGRYERISEAHPEAGEALDIVIDHAREINRDRRFQTITEMRRELQRITLTIRRGWLGQYLRLALSKLSNLYANLISWQGGLVVLALLGVSLYAESSHQELLSGVTRFLWLLLITSPATGALSNYVVRENARRQGLGSLISSGRGIGASLGWLFAIFLYRTTDFGEGKLVKLGEFKLIGDYIGEVKLIPDFLGLFALYFIFSIALTLLVVSLLNFLGIWTQKRRRRYPLGFYYGYVFFCVLLILLAVAQIPPGLIRY